MSASPRARAFAAVALLSLFGLSTLCAETTPGTGTTPGAGTVPSAAALPNADALAIPEEVKTENPLLRFEIVSLGSYPISLFYMGFIYDIKRYYDNGRNSAYLPWPFNGSNSVALDNSERVSRLEAALCLSLTVGVIDAIIHASKVKKAKRLREARLWAKSEEEKP